MIIFRKLSFWLAVLGLFLAVALIQRTRANITQPMPPPPVQPAAKPYEKALGAAGIIEACDENTALGVPVPGLVTQVHVKVWDKVVKGQPLLQLDERELQALLIAQEAQQRVAVATLERLRGQLARLEAVGDPRAIAAEDLATRRSDVLVAEAQLDASKAAIEQTHALLERLCVRAPRDGTVLQVNTRAGEYASPSTASSPVVIGDIERLQIRADVDEQLAPRVREGARAVATLKGDSEIQIPLEFVRIEPYILPKKSLSGASTERVDTRVLQVIFRFSKDKARICYVGQQVDLYIEE